MPEEPDWKVAAEAMLEGAGRTAETKYQYGYTDKHGEITHTCAIGSTFLGMQANTHVYRNTSCVRFYFDGNHEEKIESIAALKMKYSDCYENTIINDNDTYGRDYVLRNVKEMLNDVD